ncbi:MAG TPA: HlyD family efflux transporter periplasmic adaptor subunit [Cyclobacteriaceae bacterium]
MNTYGKKIAYLLSLSLLMYACDSNNNRADGYGNFEATEITVSAEGTGKLIALAIDEGDQLDERAVVGCIDTTQLALQKAQLNASRKKITANSSSVLSQITVYREQERTLEVEKARVTNLLKDSAATRKQLDDITGQLNVLHRQVASVRAQNTAVLAELESLDAQIAQLEDQIRKSVITNPAKGTVLIKYAEPGEVTSFGKPLYTIGMLDDMILRVYVSEVQLPSLRIGNKVEVRIDDAQGMRNLSGTISWISVTAEFTPKVIQTKEERVNLVYAVKVSVQNDGSLKIGMPGEIWLNP